MELACRRGRPGIHRHSDRCEPTPEPVDKLSGGKVRGWLGRLGESLTNPVRSGGRGGAWGTLNTPGGRSRPPAGTDTTLPNLEGGGDGKGKDDAAKKAANEQMKLDKQRNDNALRLDEQDSGRRWITTANCLSCSGNAKTRKPQLALLRTPAGPQRDQMQLNLELAGGGREYMDAISDLEMRIKELGASIERAANAPAAYDDGQRVVALP